MANKNVKRFKSHLVWREGLVKNVQSQESSLNIINESLRIEKISKLRNMIERNKLIEGSFGHERSNFDHRSNLIFEVRRLTKKRKMKKGRK